MVGFETMNDDSGCRWETTGLLLRVVLSPAILARNDSSINALTLVDLSC